MLHSTKSFRDDGINESDGNSCLVAQPQDRIQCWGEQGTATDTSQTDEKAKNKADGNDTHYALILMPKLLRHAALASHTVPR